MRKLKMGSGRAVDAYQDADLERLQPVFDQAYKVWTYDLRVAGDVGTCVLGAGLAVWYAPPRSRRPRLKVVVSSPGQTDGFHCVERAVTYLMECGVRTEREYGMMD